MGAIGDRAAQLGLGFQIAGVIPIIALTALDVRLQVTQVIDVLKRRIGMIITRPPIGQRHIVINPDEIDVLIGPQRVQMEQNIARPILRVIAEIFAPICGIGDVDIRPQNSTHIGGQLNHRLNRWKRTGVIADRGDPAHFRPDAKRIDPACGLAQMGIVQHEPPVPPVLRRTVIPQIAILPTDVGQQRLGLGLVRGGREIIGGIEIGAIRRAKKRLNLGARCGGLIRGPRHSGGQ